MSSEPLEIPFVDFSLQNQPLKLQIEQAMAKVIQQGDFILGQALKEFETAFASACQVKYGIGVACGTDAIALGLQACNLASGSEILTPANTFIATLTGIIRAGMTPILVDCDPDTGLLDLNAAGEAISPKTKAIIPVHLYGQMVSPSQLLDFAKTENLIIFEDAAQAHLAHREEYKAGTLGKAAIFSFYPSKNLGSFGDGGMLVTHEPEIAQKMRTLRNYGAPRKYLHTEPGTNSRLDTLQAAILNVKLPYLEQWNHQRNTAAAYYDLLLKPLQEKGIFPLENHSGKGHVYHLYVIQITKDCPINRDTLQQKLAEHQIQTGIHYPIPCHLQPAYQYLGYKAGDFPHAETLSQKILSLPMYPGLTNTQIERVVEIITELLK